MKKTSNNLAISLTSPSLLAQNWIYVPIPEDHPETNKSWELQEDQSDVFTYQCNKVHKRSDFDKGKWYNVYHNQWDGPVSTYWRYSHVSADGNDLVEGA